MKIERRSGSDERRIITGMIIDNVVCARIASRWPTGGLFASTWANLVGGWCVRYHRKYGSAPGRSVEGLFDNWAGKGNRDKDTISLVEKFLQSLSDEYERPDSETNSQFIIDLAGTYFNKIQLTKMVEATQAALEVGDVDEATKLAHKHPRIELGGGEAVTITDAATWEDTFKEHGEPLIHFPGALGKFYGTAFERDSFIGFMAPEKRGKTFWLLHTGWQGLRQRKRVALFAVGDMSKRQLMKRIASRVLRRPIGAGTYTVPTAINKDDESRRATVDTKEVTFDTDVTWQDALAASKSFMESKVKSDKDYMRMSFHPARTINVAGITAILQLWEQDGWVPDVVVVDYADILAPPFGVLETRDQINETWVELRRLSQMMHCCVVTGTQSDADSYGVDTLGMGNFSNDKRKFAHVTGMVGINQTSDEKDDGVYRLNWLVLREAESAVKRCVYTAGHLGYCNPAMYSTF